jgi:hypothetical protein
MAPVEEPTKSGGAIQTGTAQTSKPMTAASSLSVSSEEWNIFNKAFLFGVIVTAILVYLRVSAKRAAKASALREKSLA